LHPAATLATALVALGLIMSGPIDRAGASAALAETRSASEACSVGNEVSNFVCRNTWLAHLRSNYR
jgi:hypothetical protein